MKYDMTIYHSINCALATATGRYDPNDPEQLPDVLICNSQNAIHYLKGPTMSEDLVLKMGEIINYLKTEIENERDPSLSIDVEYRFVLPDGYSQEGFKKYFCVDHDDYEKLSKASVNEPNRHYVYLPFFLMEITKNYLGKDSLQYFLNIKMCRYRRDEISLDYNLAIGEIEFKPAYIKIKAELKCSNFKEEGLGVFFTTKTLASFVNSINDPGYKERMLKGSYRSVYLSGKQAELAKERSVFYSNADVWSDYDNTRWDGVAPRYSTWLAAYVYFTNRNNFCFELQEGHPEHFLLVLKGKKELDIDSAIESTAATLFMNDKTPYQVIKVMAAIDPRNAPLHKFDKYRQEDNEYIKSSDSWSHDNQVLLKLSEGYTDIKVFIKEMEKVSTQAQDIIDIINAVIAEAKNARKKKYTDITAYILDKFRERVKANPLEFANETSALYGHRRCDEILELAKMILSDVKEEDVVDELEDTDDEELDVEEVNNLLSSTPGLAKKVLKAIKPKGKVEIFYADSKTDK